MSPSNTSGIHRPGTIGIRPREYGDEFVIADEFGVMRDANGNAGPINENGDGVAEIGKIAVPVEVAERQSERLTIMELGRDRNSDRGVLARADVKGLWPDHPPIPDPPTPVVKIEVPDAIDGIRTVEVTHKLRETLKTQAETSLDTHSQATARTYLAEITKQLNKGHRFA